MKQEPDGSKTEELLQTGVQSKVNKATKEIKVKNKRSHLISDLECLQLTFQLFGVNFTVFS